MLAHFTNRSNQNHRNSRRCFQIVLIYANATRLKKRLKRSRGDERKQQQDGSKEIDHDPTYLYPYRSNCLPVKLTRDADHHESACHSNFSLGNKSTTETESVWQRRSFRCLKKSINRKPTREHESSQARSCAIDG